jgi:hypothetical protein
LFKPAGHRRPWISPKGIRFPVVELSPAGGEAGRFVLEGEEGTPPASGGFAQADDTA